MKNTLLQLFFIVLFCFLFVYIGRAQDLNPIEAFKVRTLSQTDISLSWQEVKDKATNIEIERAENQPANFKLLTTINRKNSTYQDKGLTPNTSYFYRIRLKGEKESYSPYSVVQSGQTMPDLPSTPSNLAAQVVEKQDIRLTWQDMKFNKLGVEVERSLDNGQTFTKIATITPYQGNYTDKAMPLGTTAFYKVRAFNAAGYSAYTEVASASIEGGLPTVPIWISAKLASPREASLTWATLPENAQYIEIERATKGSAFTTLITLNATHKSYQDKNLTEGNAYQYRLRCANVYGSSPFSDVQEVTLPKKEMKILPQTPQQVTAKLTSPTEITLYWKRAGGADSLLHIVRAIGESNAFEEIAVLAGDALSYTDKFLVPNTTYIYSLFTENSAGKSTPTQVSASTLPTPALPPTEVQASPLSHKAIQLKWKDNATDETDILLERSMNIQNGFVQIVQLSPNQTQFSDSTKLFPETIYFYRLRVQNKGGYSAYSPIAQAQTQASLPAMPTELDIKAISETQIYLTWKDNANNENNLLVERSEDNDKQFKPLVLLPANATAYSDIALQANKAYFYRVSTQNSGGQSLPTAPKSAVTNVVNPLAPPSNLILNVVSATRIDLKWIDNSQKEKGFKIERAEANPADFKEIRTVGEDTTFFQDKGLKQNTLYFYRVSTVAKTAISAPTAVQSTATLSGNAISRIALMQGGAGGTGNESGATGDVISLGGVKYAGKVDNNIPIDLGVSGVYNQKSMQMIFAQTNVVKSDKKIRKLNSQAALSPPQKFDLSYIAKRQGGSEEVDLGDLSMETTGKNYMLIMAADKYSVWKPLSNAVKDANDVRTALIARYRFESENIYELINEDFTAEKVRTIFEQLKDKIGANDNLLIYYSGHGYYDGAFNEGYWVPAAAKQTVSDYIPNANVMNYLKAIDAKHIFMIADACFSGAMFVDSDRGYVDKVEQTRSRWGLSSGNKELVSDGKQGQNSPFAAYLLKFLRENLKDRFPVSELIQYVKTAVADNTDQTPIGSPLKNVGNEGGEFVFYLK